MKTGSGAITEPSGQGGEAIRPVPGRAIAAGLLRRRRMPMLFAALAAGLCLPAAAPAAEIRPEIKYDYYEVPYSQGLSVSDLIARHTTLLSPQGRPLSGITDYSIWYEINHASQIPGICGVKDPKVFCKCEITLPRLTGAEADPLIRAEFAAKLEEIRRHELIHCDIAVRHAETMLESYRHFKDMPCEQGAAAIGREFERIIAECWEAQLLFDHSEYGYKDHLDPKEFQRAVGDNYRISPQTRGEVRPSLDQAVPPAAPRTPPRAQPVARHPIRVENVLRPQPEPEAPAPAADAEPQNGGIYKDRDGVWRNY